MSQPPVQIPSPGDRRYFHNFGNQERKLLFRRTLDPYLTCWTFFLLLFTDNGDEKRVSFLPSIWRLTDRNPCGFSIYTCPDVKDWLIIKNNFLSEVLIGWSVLVVRQVLVGEISGFLAYNYETCRLISAIHKLQPNEDAARIANKLLDSNFVELFGIILKGQTCLPRRDSRRRRKSFWNLRIRPGVSEVFSRDG